MVFHIPLSQTKGFVASLLRLMGLDLAAPDHTTLSRRNETIDVLLPTRVPELHEQIAAPIKRFTGDGAYDRCSVYDQIGRAGMDDVALVVPPRKPAAPSGKATGTWVQWNRHLERIGDVGRREWQKKVGYRRQSRVEGTLLRYKRILGRGLRAKGLKAQKREALVGCAVLNRMLELGRPESYTIAA
jgi:hypothetical protein